jgi:hypothetical protein
MPVRMWPLSLAFALLAGGACMHKPLKLVSPDAGGSDSESDRGTATDAFPDTAADAFPDTATDVFPDTAALAPDAGPIVPSCMHMSCNAADGSQVYCYNIGDCCGGGMYCGDCPAGYYCLNNVCHVACAASVDCWSLTRESYCGLIGDGCGGVLDCGAPCSAGETCDKGRCVTSSAPCVPMTCTTWAIRYCGVIGDGCAGVLDCGAVCPNGQPCPRIQMCDNTDAGSAPDGPTPDLPPVPAWPPPPPLGLVPPPPACPYPPGPLP